ncbi:MAG: glycosyltransferase family 39 protein [Bacteroidetes bacterium]|nr:glycosyltransferase family 39 protein [Bacteroidota bacterium]
MSKKERKDKSSNTSSAGSISDRKLYFFIFAFSFLLYGNTIKNGFSLDDEYVSRNHDQVKKGISGIAEIFSTYYTAGSNTTHLYGYRPITKATYAIEYSLFGENPHVSHFINIIIYALIGVVIFRMLKKWLTNYNIVFPFLITLLFLSHPIHTEVVASIKNRDVLLTFLGSFIMIYFSLRYIELNKFTYLLLSILFAVFAFLSKPETAPAAVIIPFVVYFFTNSSVKKGIWIALLLTGLGILVHLMISVNLPYLGRPENTMEFHDNPLYFIKDWSIRLGVAFNSLYYYLRMLIVHYPLLYFYGYNTIPIESVFNVVPLLSLFIHLSMAVFAFLNLRKKSILSFGIIWYLVYVSIIANILIPAAGIVAERFIFGASFGFCIILAYFLLKFSKVHFESVSKRFSGNPTFVFLSGIILLLFTWQTISRNNDWKDQLTLFRHDIQYLDNSVKAHETLGASLMKESNFAKSEEERARIVAEAIGHYKRTLEIYPDFAMGNNNLGTFYANLYNDCENAIPLFIKAIEVDSSFGEAMINLGLCYTRQSRIDDAISMLERGITIERGKFMISYTTLIALYFEKGNSEKGIRLFEEAVKFFPDSEVPYREMGNQYIAKGDTLESVKYFGLSLKIKGDSQLSDFVSNYFYRKGDTLRGKAYQIQKR